MRRLKFIEFDRFCISEEKYFVKAENVQHYIRRVLSTMLEHHNVVFLREALDYESEAPIKKTIGYYYDINLPYIPEAKWSDEFQYLVFKKSDRSNLKSIGEAIKHFRILKQLTQIELAACIDSTREYICLLENNRRTPSIQTVYKLSQVLDEDIFCYYPNGKTK